MRRFASLLILAGALAGLARAEEELTPYSVQEIDSFLSAFKQTYKNKKVPEEDAVSALTNLKKAYLYITRDRKEGEPEMTREEEKAAKNIVKMIARRGLTARNRPLVNLECARVLGEIGAEDGADELRRWLENVVLEEKSPHPQWVEYGFQSLAWIGPQDSRTIEFVLKYATLGRHPDIGVANQALRACYEYRMLEPDDRQEYFNKIANYLGGLYSKMRGGEAKERATYEQRYNAVKDNGLRALELLGDGTKFEDPTEAVAWWNDHKRDRWETYYSQREQARRAKAAANEPTEKEEAAG